MASAARRLPVLALVVLAIVVIACGGGKSKPAGEGTPATEADVSGTYEVVQDSDGTRPKEGATVTLVLDNGALSVHAVSAGEELTDSGTYSITNGRMTIEFKDQGISATEQPYKLDGDTLEIPVKMFSEGGGSSTWRRVSAAAEPTPGDEGAASIDAPRAPAGLSGLQGNWDLFDVDNYATAAAMKAYVESVNDKHMGWEAAVTVAVDKAKSFGDVSGVDVSPNGLNAVIHYKDGRDEDLLTERFSLTEGGLAASAAGASSQPYVSVAPASSTALACQELPGSPSGTVKTARGRLAQPGREGLQPKGSLYGVTNYNAKAQPKPITSADSPPASARKALLFAPLYDVPHPGPVYQGDALAVGTWSGFRDASGDNIACITADLKRGGYAVETILGRVDNGKPVETGIDALVGLTKKLMGSEYGVIYVMTHGAAPDNNVIKLEMGTLSDEDRQNVIGERRMRHEDVTTLEDAIREKVLREAGLPLDEDLKKTIRANVEVNGRLELWVSSEYFRLLRTKMGVNFANTLIFVNACSSAANAGLVNAFDAKVFFGFQRPPDLMYSSDAAQTIIDLLPDKARSARDAWAMWGRYHRWLEAASGRTAPPRASVDVLKAYGKNGVEYPVMTDQTVILIFRLRNGPTSAASDITKSIGVVQSCSTTFWSSGTKTGLKSPGCHNLEFGSHLPTDAEVADAVFEVGGAGDLPYGRWTLAD